MKLVNVAIACALLGLAGPGAARAQAAAPQGQGHGSFGKTEAAPTPSEAATTPAEAQAPQRVPAPQAATSPAPARPVAQAILLQADRKAMTREIAVEAVESVRKALGDAEIAYVDLKATDTGASVRIYNVAYLEKASAVLGSLANPGGEKAVISTSPDGVIALGMTPGVVARYESEALDHSVAVLKARMPALGIAPVTVERIGSATIRVVLPPGADPLKASELAGEPAWLTVHLIDTTISPREARANGALPGTTTLIGASPDRQLYDYVIERTPMFDGDMVARAEAGPRGEILVSLTPQGAEVLKRLATTAKGRTLAMVLDDFIIGTLAVDEAAKAGKLIIRHHFNGERASQVAAMLTIGGLPARLHLVDRGAAP